MKFQKILVNYKTSSTGLLIIIGAVLSIIYTVAETGTAPPQTELMVQLTAIATGIGFLVSRDVDKSTEETNGRKDLEDFGERINNE